MSRVNADRHPRHRPADAQNAPLRRGINGHGRGEAQRYLHVLNAAELADDNVAGVGDLIVARQNDRIEAGEPGQRLANRDVLRIDAWEEKGVERVAVVRRIRGRDPLTGEVRTGRCRRTA